MWITTSRLLRVLSQRLVVFVRLSQYTRRPQTMTRTSINNNSSSISKPIQNKMKTLNRAWSVHPTVYQHLRQDILVKPKYNGQIATRNIFRNQSNLNDMSFTERIKNAGDQEFQQVARELLNLPRKDLRSAKVLESECCCRLRSWNIKQTLFAMDIFFVAEYRAPMLYNSAFHSIDLSITSMDIEPKDVVQLLFYISLYRNCPISLMRDLENIIKTDIEYFTANELGLICHAFFTSNTSFVNYDLLQHISESLLSAIKAKNLLPAMASNIVKALRHAGFERLDFYQDLGNILAKQHKQRSPRQQNKASMKSQLEIFRTLYSLGFSHAEFVNTFLSHAAGTLAKNKDFFRFKDLVSLVWGSHTLQVTCPDILTHSLYTLVHTDFTILAQQYPEKFVESLIALGLADRYPLAALSHALSPQFTRLMKERHLEQHFQLLLLNDSVRVKCPDYEGCYLSQEFLHSIPEEDLCNIPKQLDVRQGLSTLLATLQKQLGGERFVKCHNVLKFSKIPDLEINLSKNGEPLPVPVGSVNTVTAKMGEGQRSSIVDRLTEGRGVMGYSRSIPENLHLQPTAPRHSNTRKIIIKVLGWNQYALNSPTLLGVPLYELYLLQDLGYEVITINPMHAAQLENMNQADQAGYVMEEILDKIHTKNCEKRKP